MDQRLAVAGRQLSGRSRFAPQDHPPASLSAAARRHKELRGQKLREQKLREQQQAQAETVQDTMVTEENVQEEPVPIDAETGEQ